MSEQTPPGTGWKETYMGGSPEAERKILHEVLDKMEGIQNIVATNQRSEVRRGFHNKGTALKVTFQVAEDIPPVLRVGFLKPGAEYEGFGRFSRSQSKFMPDASLDQRGFAFRVLADEGLQDFLLSNTPVSFAEDPVTFLKGGEVFASASKPAIPFKMIALFGVKKGLRIVRDVTSSPDRGYSFTSQRYWSRVAFRVGESAVSFTVVPVPDQVEKVPLNGPDYLTHHLHEQLRKGSRDFHLFAQFFVSEEKTPIENSNFEWKESDSPLVPVGRVILPQQDLDSEESQALSKKIEETEAFSPWNTTHIHPLGRSNRARKEAYDRSARHRGGIPYDRED